MCTDTHVHSDKHADSRLAGRQANRQTDRQTDRQTEATTPPFHFYSMRACLAHPTTSRSCLPSLSSLS
ncbi:hypothetical protein M433DRAFT_479026 [Acidomyces richmondensis BFW]|nr:hypothetical protein M433DRAFT_479026 [Acidomyces richmondensis BFW]